jgi:glycerol-3-phosphate acyltransferase PlsX
MGGDHAPREVVRGALDYLLENPDGQILLVGVPDVLQEILAAEGATENARLQIVPASQIIGMDEHPLESFREKPQSSLVLCNQLVRDGNAEASFSAGNTGAMMVSATLVLELIPGVRRAGIAALIPNESGGYVVLVDAGANVDCRPKHLEHFALLGAIYAERVLGITSPRVGLLANGEEETKGNELTKETHPLLVALRPRINYIGNVESNHITEGAVDVVACDGFVGNIFLKAAEGIGRLSLTLLKQELSHQTDPQAQNALQQGILRVRQRLDYSEIGGAPLLGVNGVAIIAHGRSDRRAISTGIRQAARAAQSGYVPAVREALRSEKNSPTETAR